MTFKIGDRVRVREGTGFYDRLGDTDGKVVFLNWRGSAAVAFDNYRQGHDCGGRIGHGAGHWVSVGSLALVSDPHQDHLAIASYYDAVTRLGERE